MPSIRSGAAAAAGLSELARILSAGLDVTRVQESILDLVSEMVGPSRASLLRSTEGGETFSIAAQRGLAPELVRSLRLPAGGGLPLWLAREGRPVHAEEVQSQPPGSLGHDVARELSALRAVVAVPLLARGELVAILALGPRITGLPYRGDQLEALFDVGTQAAAAIRNARLHHELQYARVYGARVLSSMSSGVVSIDHRQHVSVVNRRAEEILGLPAAEALDRDLRCLPSPLGDLLYEALRTGGSKDRIEIQLPRPRIVLEASVYPIAVGDAPAAGAVIVFDDVSAARQFAAEKRRREQFELIASLVRLMTREVRRPLMAVRAGVERVEGVRDAAELGDELMAAMRRDVRQLVETTEKLSALLGEGELTFELVDIAKVVEECFGDLGAQAGARPSERERLLHFTDPASGKRAVARVASRGCDLVAKGDAREFKKAIMYLVWYLVRNSAAEEEVALSISVGPARGRAGRLELVVAATPAVHGADDLERMFDPLAAVQGGVIDVGPAVSRRILEAHGGRLEASTRGVELVFRAELPLAAGARSGRPEHAS